MALKSQALKDAPIIQLDTIDSTNNYAMRLIDADTAQPGLTIVAREQSGGKGQRGRHWKDVAGSSLLMSLIVSPEQPLEEQFVFNATVAVAITEILQSCYENWDVRIKWPNDIIINDKKAGGILIENVLRGSQWTYSIIGLGLNILQDDFPADLPFATSMKHESGKNFNISELLYVIRAQIIDKLHADISPYHIMNEYNENLYRKDLMQGFTDGAEEWKAVVRSVAMNGTLEVELEDGSSMNYTHGMTHWKWE